MMSNIFLFFFLSFAQDTQPCQKNSECPPEPIYLEENTKSVPRPENAQKRARDRAVSASDPHARSAGTRPDLKKIGPPVLEAADPRSDVAVPQNGQPNAVAPAIPTMPGH